MDTESLTKMLAAAYIDEPTSGTFLASLFTDNAPTYASLISMDIVKKKKRMAVDIKPGAGNQEVLKREPFQNKTYTPPEYNQKTNLSASDVATRMAGSSAYDTTSIDTMLMQMSDIQDDERTTIERSIEWQAANGLLTGKLALINNDEIDFNRESTHTITPTVAWDQTGADIVGDIYKATTLNRTDGHVTSDTIILGGGSFEAMLKDDEVAKRLNFRRADIMDVRQPTLASQNNGGVFHGWISSGSANLAIWTYPEEYLVPTGYGLPNEGTNVPYIPNDKVIVMSSMARLDIYWGALWRFVDGNATGSMMTGNSIIPSASAVRFAPYVYGSNDGLTLEVGMRSRPICIPTSIDTTSVIDTQIT